VCPFSYRECVMRSSGVFTIILALCLLAACGGNSARQARNLAPDSNSSPGQAEGPYDLALNSLPADIHAEVDALVPPKGCNPALFFALKKSFVQALASKLASGGKVTSTPPTGNNNKVIGLSVSDVAGQFVLAWPYRNIGDYDQNGTVGITDITPIAVHYGHTVGSDPLDIVVDGDIGGTVGISDVTPLAMNFGVNVTSYTVEEATAEGGPWTTLGSVLLADGTGADQGWKQLQYTLPDANPRWLRVVPLDGQGNPGVPSDPLEFGGVGTAPVIESVSPLSGAAGAAVQFSAVVSGVGPFTYLWNFNGAATPDSGNEQPNATLSSTPGSYDCTLEVTNAAGPTLFPFTFTVGAPPNATAVNPLEGVTGVDTQFTVNTTGDAPLTYAWDFGGGATPDTSTEESPTVNLGDAGFYDAASVTVTNPYGESFFGFALTVTATGIAPEITDVTPLTGIELTGIGISASVLGTPPLTYAWDFGAAATPSTSSIPSPMITLAGPGTYPCTLDVTNAYGNDTFNFELVILPVGVYDEVEPNNTIPEANALPAFPVSGWYCNLAQTSDENDFFSFDAVFGERIEVTMDLASDDPDLDLEIQDSDGNVLASSYGITNQEHLVCYIQTGGTYYIRCFYDGSATNSAGDYWLDISSTIITMDEVESNDSLVAANELTFPLADFNGHCGTPAGYDGDIADYFTFDAAEGDFLSLSMVGTDDSYNLDLELLDGTAARLATSWNSGPNEVINYQFEAGDTGPFYLQVAANSNRGFYTLNGTCVPLVLWDTNVIDDATSAGLGQYSALTVTGGYPGCFYTDLVNFDLYFAYSDSVDGMGTWTVYPVDVTPDDVGLIMNGGVINGYPAVVYTGSMSGIIKFAICSTADGSGTWNISEVDYEGMYDPSIAQVNGLPAVAYEDGNSFLFYAANDAADGSGTWTSFPVEEMSGASYTSLIELPNGNPGISYDAYIFDEIRFASCDAPDGGGAWTVTTIDSAGMFSYPNTSAAVVQGFPAVAYYDTSSYLRYAINSAADGTGSWTTVPVSYRTITLYLSLAVIDGYPAIYYHDSNYDMYYAESVELDGDGAWTEQPIIMQAIGGSNRSLGWVNSKPAGIFMDYANNWVGFATPPGP
jgi:hypothetical protein